MPRKLAPIHSGKVLVLDFLEPLGVSQYRLAKDTGVPARRESREGSSSSRSRPSSEFASHVAVHPGALIHGKG